MRISDWSSDVCSSDLDLGDQDDQITQEFQVKSKSGSKINWIFGAYHLHWKAGYNPAVGYGDLFNLFVAPGSQLNFFSRLIVHSYSGFAQVTAPLGERTTVTVGARSTHDNPRQEQRREGKE